MAVVIPKLKQQRSLLHGLPDHLVLDQILARTASWWDCRSIRAVSKGWRDAMEDSSSCRAGPKNMFAAIHRAAHDQPDKFSTLKLAISVYDPEICAWEQLPPIPGVPSGAPLSARCICVSGKLFIIGGRFFPTLEFSDRVFAMDLRACKRRWTECSGMNRARSGFACLEWEGKILAAGGQGDEEIAMSYVEAYDPVTDSWSELPELEIPRAECTGAVIENGILCVVGGYTIHPWDEEQTVWVDSMDVLDTGRSSGWKIVESSSSSTGALRSCVISSGTLGRLVPPSALDRALGRSQGHWATVEGKICSLENPVREDDDQSPGCVMLLAIGEGSEEYATKCFLDSRGATKTILCKATDRFINPNRTEWQEIQIPFDLVPTVSCCSISV